MSTSGPSASHDEEEVGAFADINITPLTDVILVLLIIFMVTSTAVVEQERAKAQGRDEAQGRLEVSLPAGGAPEEVTAAPALVLRIDARGRIESGSETIAPERLAEFLSNWRLSNEASVVLVEADEKAAHGRVVELMEAARTAGFERLSIATTGQPAR